MTDHPNPTTLWRFRRKHSFMAHYSMIVLTALLLAMELYRPGTVVGLQVVLPFAYGSFMLIVLGYIANCAVETYIERRWK